MPLDFAARKAELEKYGRRGLLSDVGRDGIRRQSSDHDKEEWDKKDDNNDDAGELREVRKWALECDEQRRSTEDEFNKKMALSKQRSSELYLDMVACGQQCLQDKKKRQDTKRRLERRTRNAGKLYSELFEDKIILKVNQLCIID